MKRKEFIKLASTSAISLSSLGHLSFNLFRDPFFKLSLAQWSFNKSIRYGSMSPYSFAKVAKDLGFSGLEYVNQLYKGVMDTSGGDKITSVKFWAKENSKLAKENGIENVLIMIDSEGDLADENRNRRNQSIDNHKLWVDAANESGCKSIRVNLHGTNNKNKWKEYSVESLTKLASYAPVSYTHLTLPTNREV